MNLVPKTFQHTGSGSEDDTKGDPESTIGREGSRTKCVTGSKLPHASEKLGKTTNSVGHSGSNIRLGDTSSLNIDEREKESGGREGDKTTMMSKKRSVSHREWMNDKVR